MSRVDVRDADAVEQWIDGIAERHGRIDVVVNNAGERRLHSSTTVQVDFSTRCSH